jgi:hypothetical protein
MIRKKAPQRRGLPGLPRSGEHNHGRVFAERRSRGSIARGIHIADKYTIQSYILQLKLRGSP